MSKSNAYKSIIDKLTWDSENTIAKYEECLTFIKATIQNSEELQERFLSADLICQICVIDLRFDFWIELLNGCFLFHKGVVKNPKIKFILSNDSLLDILQRRITISEVYMKALIKVQGDLKYLIFTRNFLNEIFNYLDNL